MTRLIRRLLSFRPPFPDLLPDPGDDGYPAAVEAYLIRLRAFYSSRADWHRRFYRVTGVLVVLIGASLPVLASLTYPDKDLVLSILGAAVALFTALRAFYRWDQSWALLRNTERTITTAWFDYHGKLAVSKIGDDERYAAARQLARHLMAVRTQEAEVFFKDLRFPVVKPDDHT